MRALGEQSDLVIPSEPKILRLVSFYLTFIRLGSLLGPGFGPGLDN